MCSKFHAHLHRGHGYEHPPDDCRHHRVENVFSWPGLGTLCISSIFNRDLPVIQTYVLFIGVLFVVFNLVFDILQTVSDPRLRKES